PVPYQGKYLREKRKSSKHICCFVYVFNGLREKFIELRNHRPTLHYYLNRPLPPPVGLLALLTQCGSPLRRPPRLGSLLPSRGSQVPSQLPPRTQHPRMERSSAAMRIRCPGSPQGMDLSLPQYC